MDEQNNNQKTNSRGCIYQDGIECPSSPPWPSWVSRISGLPFILILGLASYFLYQSNTITLLVWLAGFFVFVVPLRYLICARCPYYGKDCSSSFGRLVPLMFKKQDGKSMRLGLWLDVAFLPVSVSAAHVRFLYKLRLAIDCSMGRRVFLDVLVFDRFRVPFMSFLILSYRHGRQGFLAIVWYSLKI